ncbi:MAG: diguanylate cyclase [Burkholderiales bacterium]|nr:diguanylate cyclase [Nitrosomonas sp.]MCP5275934.1 diguanylate cyclase [Burkholderiales bacterium]
MKLAGLVAESSKQQDASIKKIQDDDTSWADTLVTLLKQLDKNHGRVTITRKRAGLSRVLSGISKDSAELQKKINALIKSWEVLATDANNLIEDDDPDNVQQPDEKSDTPAADKETPVADKESIADQLAQNHVIVNNITDQLQELLVQTLEHVASVQPDDSPLSVDAQSLALNVHKIQSKQEMQHFVVGFKQFLEKFEYCTEDSSKLQQGLLKLLEKLLDSTSELLSEDEWIRNQLSKLRETISHPLDKRLIAEAESYIEEIAQRQDIIKLGLGDAKNTLKKMVTCLIGNIEEFSDETGDYHDKIENYSEQISQTDDLDTLNELLVEIMKDTRQMQDSTQQYRDEFIAARAEVEVAQEKIVQLESELQQMSEKVHEDHLTGILNRRGLDIAFDREVSRAQRQQQPVCYALLDIDNFKVLNDTHGHKAGDDALVYLVDAVKNVTRSDDVVARYGGEEFVILLPNTGLKEAVEVLSRIRRDLTKKYFLHENKKLLITFSAGVAEYQAGEIQENIFKRADEALYRAKKNGKNLILEAA